MQAKRIHNEYFQPIVRKSCPCGSNSVRGGIKHQVFAWGEYSKARWHTIDYFCEKCFHNRIIPRLTSHMLNCGCEFNLQARSGYSIPDFITTSMKNYILMNGCSI